MNYTDLLYDSEHNLHIRLRLPECGDAPLLIFFHGGGIEGGSISDNDAPFEIMYERGIATASVEYRLYKQTSVKFPGFIEDCAKAVDYMINKYERRFSRIIVGGTSAGGYLSMMLFFDKRYLGKYGIDPHSLDGWIFDAGQPTTHFNVLRERGLDTRLVRIDDAAPLYHITENFTGNLPEILTIVSSNDMPCRPEQTKLLLATMRHFGYPDKKLRLMWMEGHNHCDYQSKPEYADMLSSFILGK